MITNIAIILIKIPFILVRFLFSPDHFNSHSNLIKITIKYLKYNNDKHPHTIIDKIDDKYIFVGLTTKAKKEKSKKAGNNIINNPLNDNKISYIRRQATIT